MRIVRSWQVPRLYGSGLMPILRDVQRGVLSERVRGRQRRLVRRLSVGHVQVEHGELGHRMRVMRDVQRGVLPERVWGLQRGHMPGVFAGLV